MNTTKKGIQLSDHKSNLIEIKNNKKPKVFFTLDPECPLCASYSKTMSNLFQKHNNKIDFYAVFTPTVFSNKKTENYIKKSNIQMDIIIDTNQVITKFLDAQVTPECFLLDSNLNIMYNGLIDDMIKELGRRRKSTQNNYLENAIQAYWNNETINPKKTKPIGCIIER